ncbi:hypothetical protein [Nostoc sp.]|uniref:hypothetical protein n=1 Tax=Nostoc sp. TaxID=1180 RepID=UPI002FFB736D
MRVNLTLKAHVGELIAGSNPSASIHLNFFNLSAFQATLAISPQFIAGRETNAKPMF